MPTIMGSCLICFYRLFELHFDVEIVLIKYHCYLLQFNIKTSFLDIKNLTNLLIY